MNLNDGPAKPLKNILVTGAGDRIGAAIAFHLAGAETRLWIHYHSNAAGADAVRMAIRRNGFEAEIIRADLRDAAETERMFAEIERCGRLNGLVHCAAVFYPSRLDETEVPDWDRLFEVNVRGAWLCARAAGRMMRESGGGWMIFFSDSGVYQEWSEYGAYVLTKQSVSGMTRLLAKTFAPEIRVNAIAPGLILNNGMETTAWRRLEEKTLLGTSGSVEDILRAVDYLIGAAYVTGTELPVDGGYRFRSGGKVQAN